MDNFANFVVDVTADDLIRNKMSACIYCGNTTGITRDHVIAVSWTGFKRSYSKGDTVKCCRECNISLSDKPFFCISKRANYLANHYSKKYRRVLNHPEWTDEQIKEKSGEFRTTLKARNNLKFFCIARIAHCTLVAFEDSLLNPVKQNTEDDAFYYRILSDLYHGYSLEETSKTHHIDFKVLSRIFKFQKMNKIVNAFKYERGISFDYHIYSVFKAIREGLGKR